MKNGDAVNIISYRVYGDQDITLLPIGSSVISM
jgi:hypothetical protein